ncbi:MAG: aminotransferase class I/II-fold pyridoxal phosphate-dependent enzyme [Bacteroidota bacterium]
MLTVDNLNPRLRKAEYAVRGPIVQRAQELEAAGRKVIYCNIGNPQALKQKPLTYLRQVLSLVEYPGLLDIPAVVSTFPRDIVDRARSILQRHPHGTGAYTQSPGIPFIRQAVADFIAKRDGIPSDGDHIILTDGASKGAQSVIMALLRTRADGFMIPIPQYPLYSATLTLYGGAQIGYYLDEGNRWQLSEEILSASIEEAKSRGINPVCLVVINPGNPTGAVLSRENIVMIIRFAREHKVALLADEVYQENVYAAGSSFISLARVMHDMNEREVALFSLHSVSKGYLGECGHRGGYVELRNIPDDVLAEFVKQQTISLCANVDGQLATYLMVAPPQPGDESYKHFVSERDGVLRSLKRKAGILGAGINAIPGMHLEMPEGAMYGFVRFELPPPAVDRKVSMTPDEIREAEAERDSAYCLALLEETGICVVPGSGFGQEPGTFHFRTTFLPPQEEIEELVSSLKTFHLRYTRAVAESIEE